MANEEDETKSEEEWYTIEEAAGYLDISEPTLYRWMRDGKISYYKVGNSTRFKKHNLDMVAEKIVSEAEGELAANKCAVCGHADLVEGTIQSMGRVYFRPADVGFFTFQEPMIEISAVACPVCGHIQSRADTEKLNDVMDS